MRLGRAAVAATTIAAIVVGLGATPAWASDAERLAWMLRDRTIAQARAAAEWETVDAENAPAPEEPVAEATLNPGTPVTVEAPELGATVEFSGFEVDEQLTIEASPLPEEVAASAESELAAQVVAAPFEVTATTAAGDEVTEFPAEPTFDDPDAAQPVVTEVTVDAGLLQRLATPLRPARSNRSTHRSTQRRRSASATRWLNRSSHRRATGRRCAAQNWQLLEPDDLPRTGLGVAGSARKLAGRSQRCMVQSHDARVTASGLIAPCADRAALGLEVSGWCAI
ncbi:hypothetical protein M2152_001755 [Microbacteriaceae bacterium SG_E_30_P1]|uniref:Uncharacterized protein n=1 Tax=Antiquaquibacter oligotrophicus TaxID=2880260 RepID=A0ABT6KNJ0_9MICO|nr:hypothetical protein [Antiquaquibacter oligotrophicus]MDH6181573.1 hypothetical protein [Antiquaquibacter oligotrophicus]